MVKAATYTVFDRKHCRISTDLRYNITYYQFIPTTTDDNVYYDIQEAYKEMRNWIVSNHPTTYIDDEENTIYQVNESEAVLIIPSLSMRKNEEYFQNIYKILNLVLYERITIRVAYTSLTNPFLSEIYTCIDDRLCYTVWNNQKENEKETNEKTLVPMVFGREIVISSEIPVHLASKKERKQILMAIYDRVHHYDFLFEMVLYFGIEDVDPDIRFRLENRMLEIGGLYAADFMRIIPVTLSEELSKESNAYKPYTYKEFFEVITWMWNFEYRITLIEPLSEYLLCHHMEEDLIIEPEPRYKRDIPILKKFYRVYNISDEDERRELCYETRLQLMNKKEREEYEYEFENL